MWITVILLGVILALLAWYVERTKIHVYTITNTLDKWEIDELRNSIEQHGGTLNVIFTTDKIGRPPVGYGPKIMRLYEAIVDRPDGDIVCFVDAFDVLFGAPISELRRKYLSMNLGNKVLFSAEYSTSCWPTAPPYEKLCSRYNVKDGEYGYLNSGMLIGTCKGIKDIIESRWQSINQGIDDQGWYAETYLTTKKIVLDVRCELFQNLVGDQKDHLEWDPERRRWKNKLTGSYPVVFQGNGDGGTRAFLFETIGPTVLYKPHIAS